MVTWPACSAITSTMVTYPLIRWVPQAIGSTRLVASSSGSQRLELHSIGHCTDERHVPTTHTSATLACIPQSVQTN